MQPLTPRDFLKVAAQRLAAAELIAELTNLGLEAQYIGGYSVECSLKALILEKTPTTDRDNVLKLITRGAKYHRADVLIGMLRDREVTLTMTLVARMRRFQWDTNIRYEVGRRDTGETNGLLRTARMILSWVEGQIL